MVHFYERIKSKTIKYDEEITKLTSMLYREDSSFFGTSFIGVVDSECFKRLKLCGNYLNLESLLADILEIKVKSEEFICLSELILSLCEQIRPSMISSSHRDFIFGQLSGMSNIIKFDLNKLNLDVNIIEESLGKVASIGPKSELLENVLETTNDKNIENRLIRYNSLANKGNVCEKENILCAIYSYVEGFLKDPQLLQMNKRLFTNVDFLYNNLNMKHNNDRINDTFFFQETLPERERWLDNLFHDVLLVLASKKEQEIHFSINSLKAKKKNKVIQE